MIVNVLRVLVLRVIGVVLDGRVNDAGDARP